MKMTAHTLTRSLILLVFLFPQMLPAQHVAPPLTIQGLDRFAVQGARSKAMGGSMYGLSGDASMLYSNPAGLTGIEALEIRVGGSLVISSDRMRQEWYVNDYVDYLSLIVENKPEHWPLLDALNAKFRADSTTIYKNGRLFNVRPYDNMQTDWDNDRNRFFPTMLSAAIPLEFSGIRFVGGLGCGEIINMDDYFQNNTAMNPYLGQFRPAPIPVFQTVNDSLKVNLFQYRTSRKGSLYGITPALAFTPLQGMNVGVALTVLTGSTDDNEEQHNRSVILIKTVRNKTDVDPICQLDPIVYHRISSGTSQYSGTMLNLGLNYSMPFFTLGLSLKPSFTVKREWTRTLTITQQTPSGIGTAATDIRGNETMQFPLSYGVGLAIHASDKVTVAFDYEDRDFTKAVYQLQDGSSTNPWLSNPRYHFGVEYWATQWLAIRGGYREDPQVFCGDGAAIISKPEHAQAYAAGTGLRFGWITFDLAYEYNRLKYFDSWISNTNFITRDQHALTVEASYRF